MRLITASVMTAATLLGSASFLGCAAQTIDSPEQLADLESDISRAKRQFIKEDPSLKNWFKTSHGYALFPTIGKGGIGIGGAYGQGLVYEQGKPIGTTALTQASIGFQLGGQSYQEVVFFQTKSALDNFTSGNFEFAAQVSAVAATAGASADAEFKEGMAIFTIQNGGLMYEASVGGQKFSYRELN